MASITTDRRQGLNSGAAIKVPCIAATTANITLSGEQTIDGVACVTNDRVLVKNQTTASENGIYIVDTGTWDYARDWDGSYDVTQGTIVVVNGGTTQSDSAWNVATSGAIVVGTTSVTFEPFGRYLTDQRTDTGAVEFTLHEYNENRSLYVKTDFGAVGDGATSDQTAVAAAVLAAYTSGNDLFWEDGTYLTTASIANFHDVRHSGPGVVKRGSTLFYVEPRNSHTNTLYAATTGNDANDGLSSSEPVADYGVHFTRLSNYGPILPGNWVISLAAGTYNITATKSIPQFLKTRNRLFVRGPTVAYPGVPTAIVDGGSGAYSGISYIGQAEIGVEYIKFQNCTPSVGGGVYATEGANVYTNNVHIDTCTDGIFVTRGSVLKVSGGLIESCTQGIVCSVGSTGTIGYSAASTSDGPVIDACTTGISLGEVSSCHVDYATVKNCTGRGLLIYDNSRSNVVGADFQLNAIGIETRSGGVLLDSSPVMNRGTASANTIAYRIQGEIPTGMWDQGNADSTRPYRRLQFNRATGLTVTGAIAETTVVSLATIPANWFIEDDRVIEIEAWGTKTNAAGAGYVGVKFGGTAIFQAQLLGVGACSWNLKATIVATGSAAQLSWYMLESNVPGLRMGNAVAATADMTADRTVDITLQADGAADVMTVRGIALYVTG